MNDSERINPYESPAEIDEPDEQRAQAQISAEDLRWPALWLLGLSGFHLTVTTVLYLIVLRHRVVGGIAIGWLWDETVWQVLWFVTNIFVFIGALEMLRFRHLMLCRFAALAAIIPFLVPLLCVGIPFGIWALVLLAEPNVVVEFKRRGTPLH